MTQAHVFKTFRQKAQRNIFNAALCHARFAVPLISKQRVDNLKAAFRQRFDRLFARCNDFFIRLAAKKSSFVENSTDLLLLV